MCSYKINQRCCWKKSVYSRLCISFIKIWRIGNRKFNYIFWFVMLVTLKYWFSSQFGRYLDLTNADCWSLIFPWLQINFGTHICTEQKGEMIKAKAVSIFIWAPEYRLKTDMKIVNLSFNANVHVVCFEKVLVSLWLRICV